MAAKPYQGVSERQASRGRSCRLLVAQTSQNSTINGRSCGSSAHLTLHRPAVHPRAALVYYLGSCQGRPSCLRLAAAGRERGGSARGCTRSTSSWTCAVAQLTARPCAAPESATADATASETGPACARPARARGQNGAGSTLGERARTPWQGSPAAQRNAGGPEAAPGCGAPHGPARLGSDDSSMTPRGRARPVMRPRCLVAHDYGAAAPRHGSLFLGKRPSARQVRRTRCVNCFHFFALLEVSIKCVLESPSGKP